MQATLDRVEQLFDEFERDFDASLRRGEEMREKILKCFEHFPEVKVQRDLPESLREVAETVAGVIEGLNQSLDELAKQWVSSQVLVERFRDDFLLGIVGRVKMGKSTLCNALVEVFRRGLGREVTLFALREPAEEVDVAEALGKEVHAPWASRALSPRMYEKLKANSFVLSRRLAEDLREARVAKVHVAKKGEAREERIDRFETDILEATLEIQGFKAGKLCVLDAPGLASGNTFAWERATALWEASDMVVFLTSRDVPLKASDLNLLRELGGDSQRSVLFCVTRCDRYIEDEGQDGTITRRRTFAQEDLEAQRAFILRVLDDTGLAPLLSRKEITGISARLFEERSKALPGRLGVEAGLEEGRFGEFLEVLARALASDGARRKTIRPVERARKIADEVVENLGRCAEDLERLRSSKLSPTGEMARTLIERFHENAVEALQNLARSRLAEAKGKAAKGAPAEVKIEPKDIQQELSKCAARAGEDFVRVFQEDLLHLVPAEAKAQIEEFWEKKRIERRVKVGTNRDGRHVGRAAGSIEGTAIGAAVGAKAGPIGILLGATIGSFLGAMVGELVGGLFDEDVYEKIIEEKRVRIGDNFQEVEERLLRQMDAVVEDAVRYLRMKTEALLSEVNRLLSQTQNEIMRRRDLVARLAATEGG